MFSPLGLQVCVCCVAGDQSTHIQRTTWLLLIYLAKASSDLFDVLHLLLRPLLHHPLLHTLLHTPTSSTSSTLFFYTSSALFFIIHPVLLPYLWHTHNSPIPTHKLYTYMWHTTFSTPHLPYNSATCSTVTSNVAYGLTIASATETSCSE